MRVLVTGAGSVYGLGIIKALKASSLNLQVLATDTNPLSLGLFIADKAFLCPAVNFERNYYLFIRNLCRVFQVEAIFIGSSKELVFYSKRRNRIEKNLGTKIFVSNPKAINTCNDKWLTMNSLEKKGFAVPKTIRYPEDKKKISSFSKKVGFPLIVKPRLGRGSEGVMLVPDKGRLDKFVEGKTGLIIQEYLVNKNEEFTVGICLNSQNKVISKIALKRNLMDGVSGSAICSADYNSIADYCAKVASALNLFGAINVQLRLKNGKPVIFEINPRFSSSTAMRLLLGINEPESLIRSELLNELVIPSKPKSGLVLRHYNEYLYPLSKIKELHFSL